MTRRHKQVINNQCFCGPVDAIVQATSAAFRAFSTPWDGSVHAARNKKEKKKDTHTALFWVFAQTTHVFISNQMLVSVTFMSEVKSE